MLVMIEYIIVLVKERALVHPVAAAPDGVYATA